MLPSVEQLFAENDEKRKNILFLSQEELTEISSPIAYRAGHVQVALDEALQILGDKDITIFICGSPIMVDDVRQMLTER